MLRDILRVGYDPEEAVHGGSLRQYVLGGNEVQAFNGEAVRGDPLLLSSTEGISAHYGCLGYRLANHLLKHIFG